MSTQPDRPDGDGLLPCPLCKKPPGTKVGPPAMARCVTYGCDGHTLAAVPLEAWNTRATQPTRDGAEGAGYDEYGYFDLGRSFFEEFTRLSDDGNFKGFICGCSPVEILVHLINERDEAQSAPPKPAPDAVRDALKSIVSECQRWSEEQPSSDGASKGWAQHLESIAVAALSAPVPPADGETRDVATYWKDRRRLSPPCTGATEPVATPFAWTIPGDDQADCNGFIPTKISREGEFTKPLYAAPPVRGDREAIKTVVKLAISDGEYIGRHEPAMYASEVIALRTKCIAERTDAILSLPVPPGAGEREAMPIYEKRALGIIRLATEQAEEIRALSRQAPHSSSEDGR